MEDGHHILHIVSFINNIYIIEFKSEYFITSFASSSFPDIILAIL